MKYYYLEPRIAGELGNNTILDDGVHPPKVSKLHYMFDELPQDELLESFPCFIATKNLFQKLSENSLTGFSSADLEVSKSKTLEEVNSVDLFPEFIWLQIEGQPGQDDLGLTEKAELVVSEQALDIIKACCKEVDISDYTLE
jgi:hypothetical protein